jgi:transposase
MARLSSLRTLRKSRFSPQGRGAPSYTYVEATWGQTTADPVGAQASALVFYGGSPRLVVPDNPKAAIARACLYEASVQRTYGDFAAH